MLRNILIGLGAVIVLTLTWASLYAAAPTPYTNAQKVLKEDIRIPPPEQPEQQVPPDTLVKPQSLSKDTAGIVAIQLGERIAGLIFFSTQGKVKAIGMEECQKSPQCRAMVDDYGHKDKLLIMQFLPEGDVQNEQPQHQRQPPKMITKVGLVYHRTLHEVDVQNNARPDTGTWEGCVASGGIANTVPYSGEFLNCFRPTSQ